MTLGINRPMRLSMGDRRRSSNPTSVLSHLWVAADWGGTGDLVDRIAGQAAAITGGTRSEAFIDLSGSTSSILLSAGAKPTATATTGGYSAMLAFASAGAQTGRYFSTESSSGVGFRLSDTSAGRIDWLVNAATGVALSSIVNDSATINVAAFSLNVGSLIGYSAADGADDPVDVSSAGAVTHADRPKVGAPAFATNADPSMRFKAVAIAQTGLTVPQMAALSSYLVAL